MWKGGANRTALIVFAQQSQPPDDQGNAPEPAHENLIG
jgi:hypothetical protein